MSQCKRRADLSLKSPRFKSEACKDPMFFFLFLIVPLEDHVFTDHSVSHRTRERVWETQERNPHANSGHLHFQNWRTTALPVVLKAVGETLRTGLHVLTLKPLCLRAGLAFPVSSHSSSLQRPAPSRCPTHRPAQSRHGQGVTSMQSLVASLHTEHYKIRCKQA